MDSAPVVAVENLRKVYKGGLVRRFSIEALKGVSLEVGSGEIFGLLGANGAGKTTLIKVLLGIIRGNGGSARVLGRPAGDRRGRQRIGYLPENHRIPRHLTGFSALEYYGQLSDMTLADIRKRRDDLLDEVGLKDKGRLPVKSYSKGMLQRLGLAQAMLHEPELLVLDEPTDGVDPKGRAEIRETLFNLKKQGTTVFLNSHLLQEVELVCDRVAILQEGNIIHIGPVQDLTDAGSGELDVVVAGEASVIREVMADFDVDSVSPGGDGAVNVRLKPCEQAEIDRLVDTLRAKGISIQSLSRTRRTLEQAFLQLVDEVELEP